ncbi:MAG: caspase family protein [Planctomycetaceae bacterium]|jgi:hypothetical protein|nr:caspase family protein [Planctomycetaceae bacterium]
MKKKIFMIGNTNGLPGVNVDIDSYRSFFTSPVGGNWYDGEIEILRNPRKGELLARINAMRQKNYDYVITIFSGHGGFARNGTVLEINKYDELIDANELRNLSERQLLIFDCCREIIVPSATKTASILNLSLSKQAEYDIVREKYEERISQSVPQEVILWACNTQEAATDISNEGGVYSQSLLRAARELAGGNEMFVSVSKAHEMATNYTQQRTRGLQNPQIYQPRCLTSQCLPFVVNPELVLAINPRYSVGSGIAALLNLQQKSY